MFSFLFNSVHAQFFGSGVKGIIPRCIEKGDLGCRIRDGQVNMGDLALLIVHLIDLLTIFAGSLAVIMIMWAGFQMMVGEIAGTKEQAKTTMMWAIIGLVVSFLAWVIVNLIQTQLTG